MAEVATDPYSLSLLRRTVWLLLRTVLWMGIVAGSLLTLLSVFVAADSPTGSQGIDWTFTGSIGAFTASLIYFVFPYKGSRKHSFARTTLFIQPILFGTLLVCGALMVGALFAFLITLDDAGWTLAFAYFAFLATPLGVFAWFIIGPCSDTENPRDYMTALGSTTVFYHSRVQFLLGLPLASLAVFICIPLSLAALAFSIFYPSILTAISALIAALTLYIFFKIIIVFYRLFKHRSLPIIMINNEGLHLNSAWSGKVSWQQIKGVRVSSSGSFPYLSLEIDDANEYLFAFDRWVLNKFRLSPPFGVALPTLKGQFRGSERDLERTIRKHPCYLGDDR